MWDYLVGNIATTTRFTSKNIADATGYEHQECSWALSRFRRLGKVKVVDKRAQQYVYLLIDLDPPEFGTKHPHTRGTGIHPTRPRKVLKKEDLAPITTGRLSSGQPDMQRIERPRILPPKTGEVRFTPDIDYSKVEERVADYYRGIVPPSVSDALEQFNQLAAEAPAAMRKLAAVMEAAKIEILAGYSDEDLLNELLRRKKG